MVALLGTTPAAAASASAGSAAPSPPVPVGSATAVPANSAVQGPVSSKLPLHLTVVLKPRDPVGLAALADEVSTPGSAEYRHYLARGEFARRFGPSASTLVTVEKHLAQLGLRPGTVSGNGLAIPIETTAGGASAAFGVHLHNVRLAGGRIAYANDAPPRLPATIAPDVAAVVGLDDLTNTSPHWLRPPPASSSSHTAQTPRSTTALAATGGPQPCMAASNAAQASGGYTADQLAQAYSFGGLYNQKIRGAGVTVAVYELAGYDPADIAAFQACYGTTVQVTNVAVDGGPAADAAGAIEAELDIEGVISMAPDAAVEVYEGPNGYGSVDVYNRIVSDDTAQVVSTSWGLCTTDPSVPEPGLVLFQEATIQGQTVLAASGDSGSEDACSGTPVGSLEVDSPASQPWVTAVGGTTLSAIGPAPTETVWNEAAKGLGAGGGGISPGFSMPTGQQGPGVVNSYTTVSPSPCLAPMGTFCRELPDVSASADPTHGYVVYYTGTETGTTGWQAIGGTSAAAPLWAALVALADQSCGCAVGYVNPLLYDRAAQESGAFNDIASGNNDYLNTNGGTYPATVGYDMASGLGTPVATTLVTQLNQPMAPFFTADNPTSTGTVSVYYGYTFTAAAVPAATFSIASGALPAGLSLNSATGLLSGAPTTTGQFQFAVEVANGVGRPALTATLTLIIVAYIAPTITSGSSATFTVGVHSTFTVTTTGRPTAGLSQDGSLPPGITFTDHHDGTATLDGIPAAGTGGIHLIPITAANGGAATDFQDFTLTVDEPPAFTAAAPPEGNVARPYVYRFATSGFPSSSFSALGALPPGLLLTTDGVLWGKPTDTGQFAFTVAAGNGIGVATTGVAVTVVTVPPGTIFGIAGGITGYGNGGDGGPALLAGFGQPDAVAVDGSGDVFVADAAYNRVREVRPNGVITGFAGLPNGFPGNAGDGGPATSAELHIPTGLAFDTAGDAYIVDTANNRIRKVDPSGTITNFAGSPGAFRGNSGDGGPATAATLYNPTAVAVDGAGDVYIADTGDNRIRKVLPNGTITNFAGNSTGTFGNGGDGGPATAANLSGPYGVAVDGAGDVYIADTGNNRIRKVLPDGTITNFAGNPTGVAGNNGDGGPAKAAGFNRPWSVAVAPGGALLIADSYNQRIRMVDAAGVVVNFAGSADLVPGDGGDGGPSLSATLDYPMDVAVDNGGDAYVPIGGTPERVREILGPLPPVFDSAQSASFTVGVTSSIAISADNAPGIAIAETGSPPAGVTFNTATDTLAGTPGQGTVGTYPITFTAHASNRTTTTQSFVLSVDQAQFTYPVNGQNNVDTTHLFTWSTIPEAQDYIVVIGSQLNGTDLFDSGVVPPTTSSLGVPTLPALPPGRTLYATLLAEVNGAWTSYEAITFTAAPGQATFTFPVSGQNNVDPTRPFAWATIPAAQGYVLTIGTTRYGVNLVNSEVLPSTRASYATPTLPTGPTLYATLYTEINGTWSRFQAITFTAGPTMALLTRPVNGATNFVTPTDFTWNTLYAARDYDLTVGTSPLAADLFNTGPVYPNIASYGVPALPSGKMLYATLYTYVGGKWAYQQVSFTTSR